MWFEITRWSNIILSKLQFSPCITPCHNHPGCALCHLTLQRKFPNSWNPNFKLAAITTLPLVTNGSKICLEINKYLEQGYFQVWQCQRKEGIYQKASKNKRDDAAILGSNRGVNWCIKVIQWSEKYKGDLPKSPDGRQHTCCWNFIISAWSNRTLCCNIKENMMPNKVLDIFVLFPKPMRMLSWQKRRTINAIMMIYN